MRKQSGFGVIEIIVAVVVLAVLAGAGYLFYQQMEAQNNESQNSSTESATMTHDEHGDDHEAMMANWKTFTSATYNFSFKYPEDWTVEESTVEGYADQPNAVVKNAAGEEVFGVYGYLGMGCEDMPTGNEATDTITVAETEVTVVKDCNSNWRWIMAESAEGEAVTITTWDFLGSADEDNARMALASATGLTDIMAHSSSHNEM